MKKFVSVLGSAAVATLVLTGCADKQSFSAKAYEFDGGGVQSCYIDVVDRKVEVSASTDGIIYIDTFESEKEYYEVSCDNGRLTVKYAHDKAWHDFVGSKPSAQCRTLSIKLPSGVASSLTATTTNESIVVNGVSVKEGMTLDNNGGDIILDNVDVGSAIDLTAKNGDIRGSIVGDWNTFAMNCVIKKGNCNLPLDKSDGVKTLAANCNNGDIIISFV